MPRKRKTCNFDGCLNLTQVKGFCQSHSPIRCKEEGCDGSVRVKGFCRKHSPIKCKAHGCKNSPYVKGFCKRHSPIRCKASGCDGTARVKGFCLKHSPIKCKEDGCYSTPNVQGFCHQHDKCSCGITKYKCYIHCTEIQRKKLCSSNYCNHQILSKERLKLGIKLCRFCDDGLNGSKRIEQKFLDYFNEWGYHPTTNDTIIKSDNCSLINYHGTDQKNRRRVDFFWLMPKEFPYNIIAECDEFQHSNYDPTCEFKRLQDVYDQIVSNTRKIKPLVVIRFNPHNSKIDVVTKLKETIEKAFKGFYQVNDDRGFEVVEMIGYTKKRKAQFKNIMQKKKI